MKNITPKNKYFGNRIASLIVGLLLVMLGIFLIADLAWDFIKFAIGLVIIMIGMTFINRFFFRNVF